MAKPKISEMRALAKKEYKRASKGSSELDHEKEPELDYDKNGFIVLQHISEMPTKTDTDLVTDLSALEKRLDLYREKNEAKLEKDTSDHEDSHEDNPFSKPAKAGKKSRKKLLKSIFNNADKIEAAENAEKDETETTEVKKDTLDTTYGLRYAPMVSMIHGIINEYDQLADDISNDLANRPNMKTMYRSSQIANLISVKNSKLSAIKELTSIAKQITDLEYKKDKDSKIGEQDEDKAILTLTARYLRGSLDNNDELSSGSSSKKSSKKNKKSKKSSSDDSDSIDSSDAFQSSSKKSKEVRGYVSTAKVAKMAEDLEDEDDADDSALANALGKALLKHKDELEFTPYEKHINIEGKYTLAVLADADKPSSNWKFIAIDNNGKEIKGFKDKYGDLVPKKSDCRMSFNVSKMRVVDKNTSITYKLYLK